MSASPARALCLSTSTRSTDGAVHSRAASQHSSARRRRDSAVAWRADHCQPAALGRRGRLQGCHIARCGRADLWPPPWPPPPCSIPCAPRADVRARAPLTQARSSVRGFPLPNGRLLGVGRAAWEIHRLSLCHVAPRPPCHQQCNTYEAQCNPLWPEMQCLGKVRGWRFAAEFARKWSCLKDEVNP